MIRQAKYSSWLIAVLLLVTTLFPSVAQAQNFGVSPAVIAIDNLAPGGEAEFDLLIRNKEDASHIFLLSTYNPKESERREGRSEFPDASWVSLPRQVEVPANSDATVRIKVTIPEEQRWAGENWEIWLGIKPKTSSLLVINYYVRLLVSTSGEVSSSPNIGLIVGTFCAAILLGYGIYYSRRKAKPKGS